MNSALWFCVAPVARIFSIHHSTKTEHHIQAYFVEGREKAYSDFSSLLPVSPSYYDRPILAAAKADASYARAPIIKNFGGIFL